jgi:hypothetical protein
MEISQDDSSEIQQEFNTKNSANGMKSAWKAKREDWIKPEKAADSKEIYSGDDLHVAAGDNGGHSESGPKELSGNLSPKKPTPPVLGREGSAAIPIIVSSAAYNR